MRPITGREVRRHVGHARPIGAAPSTLAHEREQLQHVAHQPFLEVERRARRVEAVGIGRPAHHQLAARRLRDVDVQAARHDDLVEERLQRLRHAGLQRDGADRQLEARPCFATTELMPGDRLHHLAGVDRAARGLDADRPPLARQDAGDLGLRDGPRRRAASPARIAPGDRVVARDGARRMVERAEDRVAHVLGHVHDGAEPGDVVADR